MDSNSLTSPICEEMFGPAFQLRRMSVDRLGCSFLRKMEAGRGVELQAKRGLFTFTLFTLLVV